MAMINIKTQLSQYQEAIQLCQIIFQSGGEVRFIGGAVRDLIAGNQVTDIDLATNLNPNQIEDILAIAKIKSLDIGKEFGTITAIMNHQKIEITSLRSDMICDGRRAKVIFSNDWCEDALRRDFTINAMSADLSGNVYDYFTGIDDLKAGIVRFIGDPCARIKEDYLRILRFFRFSAYYAKQIDQSGLDACSKYAKGLDDISISRFRAEMYKIFMAPNGIEMLVLMQERQILPCKNEALIALKNLSKITNKQCSELVYLAIMLRDFDDAYKIISNSAFSRLESKWLKQLMELNITDYSDIAIAKLRQKYKELFESVMLVQLAFNFPKVNNILLAKLNKLFKQKIEPLPIKGKDLLQLGIKPGKEMGNILAIAEDIWYICEFQISKAELLNKLVG